MDDFEQTQPSDAPTPETTPTLEGTDSVPAADAITTPDVVTPGEPTPSSLNNLTDEQLFGEHLSAGAEYEGTFRQLTEGDVVTGEVVRIDREGILVDVGQKSEGLIKPQELGRVDAEGGTLSVGDSVDVMVIPGETSEGQLLLSKKRADFEKAWDHVIQAFNEDQIIHAMVTDRVKGGLTVDLGIRGFIPASHVGNGKIRNLEQFIGQSLPLKVIEVDKERRKVVLSHRLATEGEREKMRETTLESLQEGQVRAGVVRRITDYGAFVDLGGVDGLLHISEMSWSRIKHPSEAVKQNQEIQVMVLKVNKDQGRISLGMRQILPDPWAEAAQKYQPGGVVEGKVSRLVQGGAFMALDGGIEGFIKNSELAQRRIARPEDVVKVGDTLQVKVLDVRPDERRIELSRKAVEKKEERDRDDRQVRDYRSRQQEDRFTLGDILGEALAERRAAMEADGGAVAEEPQAETLVAEAPEAEAVPDVAVTEEVAEIPAAEEVAEVPAVEEPVQETPAVEEPAPAEELVAADPVAEEAAEEDKAAVEGTEPTVEA